MYNHLQIVFFVDWYTSMENEEDYIFLQEVLLEQE